MKSGPTLLVVDDDEGISEAITMILEDEGYVVEPLLRGDTVLEVAEKLKPAVILLDVLISGTDGRDICRQLKQSSELKAIPVVMLSAHPNAQSTVFEAGADGFIAKPFETDELLARVKKFCS